MNSAPSSSNFFSRILTRAGGYQAMLVVLVAQLITTPLGLSLAAVLIYINTGLQTGLLTRLAVVAGTLMLIRNILLLFYVQASSRKAVLRLGSISKGEAMASSEADERLAWKQITSLPWRYIAVALASLFLIVLPLSVAYLYFELNGTLDQVYYVIFAAIASGLINALFEVFFVENSFTNARLRLIPSGFESQAAGVRGIRLFLKFLGGLLALIIITTLTIAPIGYHQTIAVIYEDVNSLAAVASLQSQSFGLAFFSLLVGFAIAILITTAISGPVRRMIQTFQQIEAGDLKQRVPVTATDEVGELAVYFNRMISRLEELQSGLEKRVAERTEQLNATIEVGREASSILDPDELITKVVNLITDRFNYYYAAIFITDRENRWAELRDATGMAGKTLKAQGHRLELGGQSMVGAAITTSQARIAEEAGTEKVRFVNPLLPDTRSEIALPLIVGGRTIGALDVQSTLQNAFGSEVIETLQGMANQVAVALENARLFQETQASLTELAATHRLYISQAWTEAAREHDSFEYIGTENNPSTLETTSSVNVPLTLRDQIIGQLQLDGQQDWTEEERNLIEAVATQASLALENARLLEESQQVALRERLVTEITGKIWSSPNTEIILQTAVRELGRALRADEATIELKTE